MATTHLTPSTAPPAPPTRPRVVAVGTTFAIAGVVMFFATLVGIYLLLRSQTLLAGGAWLPEKVTIPLTQPNMLMATLLMSSVTMQWAARSIRNDDRPHAYLALGVTLLLGVAYLNMAAYLYSVMTLDISTGAFAVLTYTISGAHVVLVIAAMLFAGLMAIRALGGQFTSRNYDGLAAAAMFWHATVAVFFVIWIAIYIFK